MRGLLKCFKLIFNDTWIIFSDAYNVKTKYIRSMTLS